MDVPRPIAAWCEKSKAHHGLEIEDTRFLIIDFSSASPKPADLKVGDGVDVMATEDKDGRFHASSIQPDRDIAKTIIENDQIVVRKEEGRTGRRPRSSSVRTPLPPR